MKKLLSVVLIIVITAMISSNVLSVKTIAANTTFSNQKCGEDTYATLDANGVLTISGTGDTWDFRVEGDIYTANYGIAPWNECKDAIKKVVFTDKVTYIGADAFYGCDNLTEVAFNEHMQRIGNFAFMYCSNLDTVNWSTGLTGIGQQAFAHTGFTQVSIPDGVSFIDACVFEFCWNLEKAYIGSCSAGSFIIGNSIFRGCTKLEEITVSKDHFALISVDGILYNAEIGVDGVKYPASLQDYPSGKKALHYTLPETVRGINQFSIEGNPYLETVTLHNNISEMHNIFNGIKNLKNLTIPSSVVEIREVGGNCENLEWLKNESNCDYDLLKYYGYKWLDEDGNEITTIKAKSIAYCYNEQKETESYNPPVEPSTELQTEMPTNAPTEAPAVDNYIEETAPVSGDNANSSTTENSTVKEDVTTEAPTEASTEAPTEVPTTEAVKEPEIKPSTTEDATAEDISDEEVKEPQIRPIEDIIECENIVDVFNDQAEENVENVELIINKPTVVDKELFECISQRDKAVVIGVVDANNRLQYSWEFSKNAIKNTDASIDLNISFEVEKKNEIEEKMGNINSKYMEFSHSGELPSAATISMYVGDTYSDGEKLYLYYYDENANEVLMVGDKAIEVKDGYVTYTITHCSIYFMDIEKFNVPMDNASLKDANVSVKELVINNGQYEVTVEENIKEEETTTTTTDNESEEKEEPTSNIISNDNENEGKTPKWILPVVVALIVGGIALAVVLMNKKKQSQ